MRAVLPESPRTDRGGEAPAPRLGEIDAPRAAAGEVLLAVRATALNRADLLQIAGHYPPVAGESAIPGLEAAGEIVELGAGVEGWRIGARVAALLAGGGHAELVAAPVGQLLRVPDSWTWAEAAALPEAAITAWTNLAVEGALQPGERVLVSGATSGVGSYIVQVAHALGAQVVAAGRERERLERLRALGAGEVVLLDELPDALDAGGGRVHLVLDLVGGEHLPRLVASLLPRGRLVLVGLMAGRSATLDLGLLLRSRLTLVGSVLRSRSRAEKARLVDGFVRFAAERLARRELLPLVDRVFDFAAIAEAYAYVANGRPLGKVVVALGP